MTASRILHPAILAVAYVALSIALFNWYPFNSVEADTLSLALFTLESLKLYVASASIYLFTSTLIMLLIPLTYVAARLSLPGVDRLALYSLALSAPVLLLTTVMGLPAYLAPEGSWAVGIAFTGLVLSATYISALKLLYGGILFLILLGRIYGSIRIGVRRGYGWGAVGATIVMLILGAATYLFGAYLDGLIVAALNCRLCPQIYFRGWSGELLRHVSQYTGSPTFVYAEAPTVGELSSTLINAFLSGLVLTKILAVAASYRRILSKASDTPSPGLTAK